MGGFRAKVEGVGAEGAMARIPQYAACAGKDWSKPHVLGQLQSAPKAARCRRCFGGFEESASDLTSSSHHRKPQTPKS